MTDTLHPAVTLLVSRMESNPEEFLDDSRWDEYIDEHRSYFSPAEETAYALAYSRLHMDKLHEKVMAELLNPKEEETPQTSQTAYVGAQSNHWATQQSAIQNAYLQQANFGGIYNTVLGAGGGGTYVTPVTKPNYSVNVKHWVRSILERLK